MIVKSQSKSCPGSLDVPQGDEYMCIYIYTHTVMTYIYIYMYIEHRNHVYISGPLDVPPADGARGAPGDEERRALLGIIYYTMLCYAIL